MKLFAMRKNGKTILNFEVPESVRQFSDKSFKIVLKSDESKKLGKDIIKSDLEDKYSEIDCALREPDCFITMNKIKFETIYFVKNTVVFHISSVNVKKIYVRVNSQKS